MTGHRLEVADVFRRYGSEFLARYGSSLSTDQKRAFRAIVACRTRALGGHIERCDHCGHEQIWYNSCRNRHCPKCQAAARAQWMEARAAELLPIAYFHITFTVPQEIGPVALQNQRIVYSLLFRAASETLREVAANPKHLGAEIGVLAVLHTWGQKLDHHPHLHCVVTGGGLSADGSRWIHCKRSRKKKPFFAPVCILSEVFRGKFIAFLKRAYTRGELQFHGQLASLAEAQEFEQWLDRSVAKGWVVDARRPFASADVVLKYLARYTHRVAISNGRLISLEEGKVRFRYKDYADGGTEKTTELEAVEFIRRFLLHVLPLSFMKIRYFGFLANRFRQAKLALCRLLLGVSNPSEPEVGESETDQYRFKPLAFEALQRCPVCGRGKMVVVEEIPGEPSSVVDPFVPCSRAPPRAATA